jgi:hypothetical protein
VILAAAFLGAGAVKIADPAAFAVSIARLRVVPDVLLGPAAILVPWLELTAAAALFSRPFRPAALALLLAMLGAFTALLAAGWARGASSCGCFGMSARIDLALGRNVLLIAVAAYLLAAGRRPTDQSSPRVTSSR